MGRTGTAGSVRRPVAVAQRSERSAIGRRPAQVATDLSGSLGIVPAQLGGHQLGDTGRCLRAAVPGLHRDPSSAGEHVAQLRRSLVSDSEPDLDGEIVRSTWQRSAQLRSLLDRLDQHVDLGSVPLEQVLQHDDVHSCPTGQQVPLVPPGVQLPWLVLFVDNCQDVGGQGFPDLPGPVVFLQTTDGKGLLVRRKVPRDGGPSET